MWEDRPRNALGHVTVSIGQYTNTANYPRQIRILGDHACNNTFAGFSDTPVCFQDWRVPQGWFAHFFYDVGVHSNRLDSVCCSQLLRHLPGAQS